MPSTYTTRVKRKKLLDVLDYNKDGSIGAEDIIVLSLKTPGIRINRDDYLAKELSTVCGQETIDLAISTTPLDAGISKEEIERLADEVVKYERNCVSGISSFLGLPGGYVAIATVPADIIQYYGFLLRAAQKLMYLYGFPQIVPNNGDSGIDTATINAITLCMGVMYAVNGASKALFAISKAFANGVEKKLLQAA